MYESVPDGLLETEIDTIKAYEIRDLLRENKGEPVTATKIAKQLNMPTSNTQVQVRQLITWLLITKHEPIISTGKGFMYAKQPEQLSWYAERLRERIKGIERRISACFSAKNKMREECV